VVALAVVHGEGRGIFQMTESILQRLTRLEKEATPSPWTLTDLCYERQITGKGQFGEFYITGYDETPGISDGRLMVETRNALPAILRALRAAQETLEASNWDDFCKARVKLNSEMQSLEALGDERGQG